MILFNMMVKLWSSNHPNWHILFRCLFFYLKKNYHGSILTQSFEHFQAGETIPYWFPMIHWLPKRNPKTEKKHKTSWNFFRLMDTLCPGRSLAFWFLWHCCIFAYKLEGNSGSSTGTITATRENSFFIMLPMFFKLFLNALCEHNILNANVFWQNLIKFETLLFIFHICYCFAAE